MYWSTSLSLLAVLSPAEALMRGLNFGAKLPSGACRTQKDYEREFITINSNPPYFDTVRLFASSDCLQLPAAVPAALKTGVKILAGVWTQNEAHYQAEKNALIGTLASYPNWQNWLVGISVGSEDLYRNEAPARRIAEKINEVRKLVRAQGVTAPVGHVDTWTAWTDDANKRVIQASDFIGTDGYPYWQGARVPQSSRVFWSSVAEVQETVQDIKPGTPIWVTETGWPVSGKKNGASIASMSNAQSFWKVVACDAMSKIDIFWFCYSETGANPDFSLYDMHDQPLFNLQC